MPPSVFRVRIVDDEERERIEGIAQQMNVQDPIFEGALRQDEGRCPFMQDNLACGIHGQFGKEAKPLLCQQYPLICIQTEDSRRLGIDPGCYTAFQTWQTAEPFEPDSELIQLPILRPPEFARSESALLGLLGHQGVCITTLLRALLGAGPGQGLEPDFAGRWVERLQKAPLHSLIDQVEAGDALRKALTPLLDAISEWEVTSPPAWSRLGSKEEEWAVEVTRRMIWLRLLHQWPSPESVCAMTLLGAIAVGWAGLTGSTFGAALSGWTRALRAPVFATALIPDAATLGWLLSKPPAPEESGRGS